MGQIRIVVEYTQGNTGAPIMRWERTGVAPTLVNHQPVADNDTAQTTETFALLGRAFEVAQREEGASFADSLLAFFRGAMVCKDDLTEVLALMKEE